MDALTCCGCTFWSRKPLNIVWSARRKRCTANPTLFLLASIHKQHLSFPCPVGRSSPKFPPKSEGVENIGKNMDTFQAINQYFLTCLLWAEQSLVFQILFYFSFQPLGVSLAISLKDEISFIFLEQRREQKKQGQLN